MGQRVYNILFNLHTVSGIVISVALYVIFFAGSFSFFRDEIVAWERNEQALNEDNLPQDIDQILTHLDEKYVLEGRDVNLKTYYAERAIAVNLSASKDSLAPEKAKQAAFFYIDPVSLEEQSYTDAYSLGEFLYRLHFFAQIYYPVGYYLSGFVAFFFLFAIITGVLVHWKKIVSNFYTFRPWAKLKTLWTDAHTALGILGLPFQFILAVTGAFFMLKALLVAPSVLSLYHGDQAQLYKDLEYDIPVYEFTHQPIQALPSINTYIEKTQQEWKDYDLNEVAIHNYGDANMQVTLNGKLDYQSKFNAPGSIVYTPSTSEQRIVKDPYQPASYLDAVKNVMFRLHFGDYGGYFLRIVSFILGILSCIVIISGVLIWLVARDRKNLPEKKRKFYNRVARIYMAICLSMYPVTAAAFIAVKVNQGAGQSFLYWFYFLLWAVLSVFLILKKDLKYMSDFCLLSGGILAFLIPICNGIFSQAWFWQTFAQGHVQIAFIDVSWIVLAIISFFAFAKSKKSKTKLAYK